MTPGAASTPRLTPLNVAPVAVEEADARPARPLRVSLVSKSDAFGGGASRVAQEIAALGRAQGHLMSHWASWWGKEREELRPMYTERFTPLIRKVHTLTKRFGFPETVPLEFATLAAQGALKADVVHFHDLSSAISPLTVLMTSLVVPTVWTIHDCSPFTGGCLYPMGCERYKTGCGECPQLGQWPIDTRFDFTRQHYKLKELIARRGRVTYVSPSEWMSKTAYESGMMSSPPLVLPNGVDTELFSPNPAPEKVRRSLGVPEGRKVVLISAGNLLDERKGTIFGLRALRKVRGQKWFALVVGHVDDKAKAALDGIDYASVGYIGDAARLAEVYAAADLFLFCSLADNQPLSILETMSCGVPMLGFETGGIPEMVVQDQTGWLVPQRDVEGLVEVLKRLEAEPYTLRAWGQAARRRAKAVYGHRQFFARHMKLYQRLAGVPSLEGSR